MEVQILQDRAAVAAQAAQIVAAQITEKPDCVLGLPTGETPIGMYNDLAAQCAAGKLDFSRVTTFNLDEYYPIAPEHPGGIDFCMYHADQYAQPKGDYSKVYSADDAAWYKQYAADTVERKPYQAEDGKIAYHEKIVQKLPNPPQRKDRM